MSFVILVVFCLSPHELGTDIKEFKPGLRRAMVDLLLIRSLKKDKRKKRSEFCSTCIWTEHKSLGGPQTF